jgi:hypothetical protein
MLLGEAVILSMVFALPYSYEVSLFSKKRHCHVPWFAVVIGAGLLSHTSAFF